WWGSCGNRRGTPGGRSRVDGWGTAVTAMGEPVDAPACQVIGMGGVAVFSSEPSALSIQL
ncbi:MAG: hypothetical protein WAW26_13045, partial [Anaerolineae bacterium]